tara:strand:+ start:2252 stop:3103 length:852 start_codon:yes stop_codon:yes gene_type:complete
MPFWTGLSRTLGGFGFGGGSSTGPLGPQIQATGGTETEAGGYKYHTFTSPGTFTLQSFNGQESASYMFFESLGGGGGGAGAPGGPGPNEEFNSSGSGGGAGYAHVRQSLGAVQPGTTYKAQIGSGAGRSGKQSNGGGGGQTFFGPPGNSAGQTGITGSGGGGGQRGPNGDPGQPWNNPAPQKGGPPGPYQISWTDVPGDYPSTAGETGQFMGRGGHNGKRTAEPSFTDWGGGALATNHQGDEATGHGNGGGGARGSQHPWPHGHQGGGGGSDGICRVYYPIPE